MAISKIAGAIHKSFHVTVVPLSTGLEPVDAQKIMMDAPTLFDGLMSSAGGFVLRGPSGIQATLQPTLRQVTIHDSEPDAALDRTIEILSMVSKRVPTQFYMAVSVGQTFHLQIPKSGVRTSALLLRNKLFNKASMGLFEGVYGTGIRFYITTPYQTSIVVDPLLADPKFLFFNYHSTFASSIASQDLSSSAETVANATLKRIENIAGFLGLQA